MKVGRFNFYWKYHLLDEITQCFAENENRTILAQSQVARYYKDIPNREKGRKFALAILLKSHPLFLNKEFRKQVWETYRTMTKVPRWGASDLNTEKVYEEEEEKHGETLQELGGSQENTSK